MYSMCIHTQHYKKKQKLESNGVPEQSKNKNQKLGKQFYKLKDILVHKDGFRLFAAHLMKELLILYVYVCLHSVCKESNILQICH